MPLICAEQVQRSECEHSPNWRSASSDLLASDACPNLGDVDGLAARHDAFNLPPPSMMNIASGSEVMPLALFKTNDRPPKQLRIEVDKIAAVHLVLTHIRPEGDVSGSTPSS